MRKFAARKFAALAGSVVLVFLGGCSAGGPTLSIGNPPVLPAANTSNGSVHGGQQPVVGAMVQLWQVGTGGYGLGASPLGTPAISQQDGSFSITGNYSCSNAVNGVNSLVYITATGGNPSNGVNNELAMMAALGPCSALTPSTFIQMNEVTTVAAVYALAQFMNPTTGGIGSYGYSTTGLTNAFATASNLVNIGTGQARVLTPSGNGQVPQAEINTLANIMASCINTSSIGASPSTGCSTLFAAATPAGVGASAPTNTITATLNIALYPWSNPAQLFATVTPTAPFSPTLPVAPNDWTMALDFAGTTQGPEDMAIDAQGNIWVANYHGGGFHSSVSKLSNLGVPASGSPFISVVNTNSLSSAVSIAIDPFGSAWVVDQDFNQFVQLDTNGNLLGTFTFPETQRPLGIAVDGGNHVWVTNRNSNSVTETRSGNAFATISPDGGYIGGGLAGPLGVAIDGVGNAWIANNGFNAGNSLSKIAPDQTVTNIAGGGLASPAGVAIDSDGDVWVANNAAVSVAVSEFTSNGTPVNNTGFTGGGISQPISLAIDGNNNVWIANQLGNSISELSSNGTAISPSTGYLGGQVGNLNSPWALRIDSSGNVWVSSFAATAIPNTSLVANLTEFVGLAAPAVTPLSVAMQTGQFGVKPGTPIPVTVVSATLPNYTTSVNFTAQLQASGGNTGSFAWSLANGTTLPTGMSLSGGGLISGSTLTTGATSFTVKACDSANATNCATKALSLTASGSLTAGGSESTLSGRYIMHLGGFNNGNGLANGFPAGYAIVQAVTFDGAGGITAASEDFNNSTSHSTAASATVGTGYYTLGADHRGVMVINYPAVTLEYAIAVGNLNGSSIAQDIRLIEFDNTRAAGRPFATGAGVGKLQTTTSLSTNQAYVFGLQGETPCTKFNNNGCPNTGVTPFGAVTAVGRFFLDNANGISQGQEDAGANNNSYTGVTFTGTYTTPDATGRGSMTIATTGTLYPNPPTTFVYYVVSPTELYILSVDGHSGNTMLSGEVRAQTATFTNASVLSGNYVVYENTPVNGNGVNYFPDQAAAEVLLLTFSGNTVNLIQDANNSNNGKLELGNPLGPLGYTIDAAGRAMFTGVNGTSPVIYLANASGGFGTEQPSVNNQGDTGFINIEQQTGGPFSCATSAGTYMLGSLQPPVRISVNSGTVQQNGIAASNAIVDDSEPNGVLTQGSTSTLTCTDANLLGSSGRFMYKGSAIGTVVGYSISPSKVVTINAVAGEDHPKVTIIQK